MRQVWIPRIGPPDVLEVREAPDPEAKDGQVRVRVRAAGVNFADLMARMGLYPDAPKLPAVVGYEAAGTVDQVGAGVTGFAVGDRVVVMPRFGGYSDTIVVPAAQAMPMPSAMSFEEGAALPVVYLTAHHMMLYLGNLHEGSTVLVHSAAGGVGIAAIQIAKTRNCTIIGTASPSKHDFLRAEGCQHPIDYENYGEAVRKIVGKRGVDLILDAVGGRSYKEGYELLGPCGRLAMFGASSASTGDKRSILSALRMLMAMPSFKPLAMMNDNRAVSGTNMGHLFDHQDLLVPQLSSLVRMYEKGEIKPKVDVTFPFAEAAKAHQHLHDRKAKGKVLLVP